MAATYTRPSHSDSDAVRFWAGDTDTTAAYLQDAEIAYILTLQTNIFLAAADACEQISSLLARKADFVSGTLQVRASQRSEAYAKRALSMRRRAATTEAGIFAGGLVQGDKDALDQDSSAVQPSFRIGQDDEPGTATTDSWPYSRN